jgi:hypothetical protein
VTFAGDLARLPELAALSGALKFKVDGFAMPALSGRFETAPGSFEGSLSFRNSTAELDGSLSANLRKGFDVIEGLVQARFAVRAELGGKAEAKVGLDFKGASLHAPAGFAWQKAPGSEASLQFNVAVDDYRIAGKAASATFDLAGKGLVYGQLGLKGRVDARFDPEGMPTAFKLVCDSIEADETSLRFEAEGVWPRSLDARLSGARLDLRPLVHLAAPQFAALNAPADPGPARAGAASARPGTPDVRANPVPARDGVVALPAGAGAAPPKTADVQAPAAPNSPGTAGAAASCLPVGTKLQVALQEIVLGGGRTIAPFTLVAELRGARPVSGELSFASLNHGMRASLQPGPDHSAWSVKIDDFADLLVVGTAAFHELPAPMTAADTTLGGLVMLPERFIGGQVTAEGALDLDDVRNLARGRLQVADLRLRSEIPFLSSIAALVKRPVRITIPFKEFRIDSFTFGQDGVHLKDIFLAGPISLTGEKFDYDFVKSELFLRGKVFGIWFEVKGPRNNLEYYLADKNAVLSLLTTEDEFQW